MTQNALHGIVVPVITPTDRNDCVDESAFRGILRFLIDAGVHGIFVGGSAGEGPLLTLGEWQRMVEIAFDEVHGKLPLLAGAMDCSTKRVVEKIAILKKIGYAHFVCTPTFYLIIRNPDEHLRIFGAARETAGDMNMIVYNIPQCTGSSIPLETLLELGQRGWITCCKESSGDLDYLLPLIRRGAEIGLDVLTGDELSIPTSMAAGAKGIVPVCATVYPQLLIDIYTASRAGDTDKVVSLHQAMLERRQTLVLGGAYWLAGIKQAMAMMGFGSGQPVSPLQPVGNTQKSNILAMLKADRVPLVG
jgi:4-hydroxy-tetrahydrodipicolinate synthase